MCFLSAAFATKDEGWAGGIVDCREPNFIKENALVKYRNRKKKKLTCIKGINFSSKTKPRGQILDFLILKQRRNDKAIPRLAQEA
jgi:hypothetical protein